MTPEAHKSFGTINFPSQDRMMKCPLCREAMKTLDIGDVSIDECSLCKGLWFDKGELEEFKDQVEPDLRFLDFEIWNRKALFNINEEPINCPRCRNVSIRSIKFQEPNLDIKFCPRCEGVWLDFGNFKDIIDAFQNEAETKSASEYAKASLKEASDIVMNPKNLISEWKDLKAVLRMLRYRVFVENPKIKSILVGIQKSLPL
jgi:Zn-finger nucleic acid-binding protein